MARLHECRKRILVTGGAGFIGSHLVDRLLEQGHEVLCVDNLFAGDKRNVHHLHGRPRFEFMRHDICRPLHVAVDEIYNLAGLSCVGDRRRDPVRSNRTVVQGEIEHVDRATRLGCRIVQGASYALVGGFSSDRPDMDAKRCAETAFFSYHLQHGVDAKVARIFDPYGPRMRPDDGGLVGTCIRQALAGEDLTFQGDPSQTIFACHVDDVVEGLLRLMDTPPDVVGPANIGDPSGLTVMELMRSVAALTGSSSKLNCVPSAADHPGLRGPNIDLAIERLGWRPRVPLDEGLGTTIVYVRDRLAA